MVTKVNVNRHGPNRFSSYREIHETVIRQFIDREFIGSETLEFKSLLGSIRLKGEIACRGEILIVVDKMLDIIEWVDDDSLIQTKWYSYNVSVQGRGNLLRYDNQDVDYGFRDGHQDEHHKHTFDWQLNREFIQSPTWIGHAHWPTLGDVLFEVEHWYFENLSLLEHPDCFPVLGLREHPPSLEL